MHNPYNASRPGHLFTGHERLRRRVIDGLATGHSFAISGGRRCGKTSLLMQLAEDLTAPGGRATATFLPRLLDMQAEVPQTTGEFFAAFSRLLVQGTDVAPWPASRDVSQSYRDFLAWAQAASVPLAKAHGPNWVTVFLVDEIEVAAQHLPSDECFHNLRNWLMVSPLRERVRVVVTGVGQLARLTAKGSPLNNLEPEALGALAPEEAKTLIAHGFADAAVTAAEPQLLALTGGHPWILQGVLGYLWEERDHVTQDAIVRSVSRFVRNRDDVFVGWLRSFESAGEALFSCVARAATPVGIAELRRALPKPDKTAPTAAPTLDGVLRILGYHGVIAEIADGKVQANGTIFRDWFVQNHEHVAQEIASVSPGVPAGAAATAARNKRVFIVFGRDRKVHAGVVRFLRTLGLEPVEWNAALEATRNGAASVKEILDKAFEMAQAVIVLLTPDDEARLRPAFHGPQEPVFETSLTPQPRPNVIFEAGFAMARFPTSTILVRFDRTTRLFTDIGGVFLLDLSNDFSARQDFVQRLRTCGLDVDDSGTAWHTAQAGGDFTPAT